jgi:hypothetical protein
MCSQGKFVWYCQIFITMCWNMQYEPTLWDEGKKIMNICDNFRSKYIWHSPTYVELDWMNELWFWICLIPVIPDLVFLENGIISTLRQVYVFHVLYNKLFIFGNLLKCTVNSTSDYTLWTLYRSYFKDNSANIELNVHTVTCNCFWPYKTVRSMFFFVFLCECGNLLLFTTRTRLGCNAGT